MSNVTRRLFLQGLLGATAAGAAQAAPLRFFKPTHVDNRLAAYPGRDWEETYRNIFKPDSSFVFLCAPNDTHNCLLRAYVKNGIVVRIGPTFGYGKAKDLYGNTSSHRWDPRLCQKGLALVRRIVEMHNGTVSASSAGIGQGAEFVVRLPLAMPADAACRPAAMQPSS